MSPKLMKLLNSKQKSKFNSFVYYNYFLHIKLIKMKYRKGSGTLKKDFSEVELCQIDLQQKLKRKNKSFSSLKNNTIETNSSKVGKIIKKETIETGNVISVKITGFP